MNKNLFAFTLIELLVVIAIIGILSGLIVVAMGGITSRATIAKSQVFSNSLRNALMLNLISEWKFDGTTSDGSSAVANDVLDTWGTNNGTVSATAPTVKTSGCVNGSCLQFNGTSTYIDAGTNINSSFTGALTIGAWINQTRDAQGAQYIVSNDRDMSPPAGGFDIGTNLSSGNLLYAHVWKNSSSTLASVSGTAVPQGVWQYVVFTFNGTNLLLYQNGAQTGNVTIPADTILAAPYHFIIGAMAHNVPLYFRFNGLIDEVRIYNAAMPTSQIKEQYYAGLNSLFAGGQLTKEEYLSRIREFAQR